MHPVWYTSEIENFFVSKWSILFQLFHKIIYNGAKRANAAGLFNPFSPLISSNSDFQTNNHRQGQILTKIRGWELHGKILLLHKGKSSKIQAKTRFLTSMYWVMKSQNDGFVEWQRLWMQFLERRKTGSWKINKIVKNPRNERKLTVNYIKV